MIKEKLRETQTDPSAFSPDKFIKELSQTDRFVYILLLRKVREDIVSRITQLPQDQVEEKKTFFEEKGFLRKSQKTEENQQLPNGFSQGEEFGFALIREYLKADFIGLNLRSWKDIHRLYKAITRPLPKKVTDVLRLEAFLTVRLTIKDPEKMKAYESLGKAVNRPWFNSAKLSDEEMFIAQHEGEIIANRKREEVLPGGFMANKKGILFRETDNFVCWPVDIVDGKMVHVDSGRVSARK